MLSENTYKKYLGNLNDKGLYNPPGVHPADPKSNHHQSYKPWQIIYTPHDCELPDPEDYAIGTVLMCRGYHNGGQVCNDLWEVQNLVNAPTWVRVVPRWKQGR